MLRTGPYKYIAYGDGITTPPQLFNLDDDPAELNDVSTTLPDVVVKLDSQLRMLIDYPAVTEQVDDYNRLALGQWKIEQGANFSVVLSNLIWFWDWARDPEGNVDLINMWLSE